VLLPVSSARRRRRVDEPRVCGQQRSCWTQSRHRNSALSYKPGCAASTRLSSWRLLLRSPGSCGSTVDSDGGAMNGLSNRRSIDVMLGAL
jgi:hypothetical protein